MLSFTAVLPTLSRIRVTGADRVRFVHNFCTNNIQALTTGQACEAFFVNLKARVLAHGWVLADDDALEIWMLPGDEAALLSHLDRYIIADDVALESRSETTQAAAVAGNAAAELAGPAPGHWQDLSLDAGQVRCLALQWNGQPWYLCAAESSINAFPDADDQQAGLLLDRLRILEGFPIAGQDVSEDHLAPEAGRNDVAISYTKGCYLGQEPIARLDALGQANRRLAVLEAGESAQDSDDVVEITSWNDTVSPAVGLGFVRTTHPAGSTLTGRTPQGQTLTVTVASPRSATEG